MVEVLIKISKLLACLNYQKNEAIWEITEQQLILAGVDISDKLLAKNDKFEQNIEIANFNKFIDELGNNFVRLNHVGINYRCPSIERENEFYKKIIEKTNLHLYEEKSDNRNTKWLFIGNLANWQSPLFELVLSTINSRDDWFAPGFQIDIDTNLKQKDLENILSSYFGKNFVMWKFDIPNYGMVMEMGILGTIGGIKICLGVGTDIRNTKYNREKGLHKLL